MDNSLSKHRSDKSLKTYFARNIYKNRFGFLRSFGLISLQNIVGAGISAVTTPIISFWFGPKYFGYLASSISIAAILSPLISLKLETLVYRISGINKTNEVVSLAFSVCILNTLIVIIFGFPFSYAIRFNEISFVDCLAYWTATALIAMSYALNELFVAVQVRNERFFRAGISRIISPTVLFICAFLLKGDANISNEILLFVSAFSMMCGAPLLMILDKCVSAPSKFSDIISEFKSNFGYIKFSVPQSIINASAFTNLFTILVSYLYGSYYAGILYIAIRLIAIPTTLFGSSASNLIAVRGVGMRDNTFKNLQVFMMSFSIALYGFVILCGYLVPIKYIPHEWRPTLSIILPISVLCAFQFGVGSFGRLFLVWGKERHLFYWDILRLFAVVIGTYATFISGVKFNMTIYVFCLIQVAFYIALAIMLEIAFKAAKKSCPNGEVNE